MIKDILKPKSQSDIELAINRMSNAELINYAFTLFFEEKQFNYLLSLCLRRNLSEDLNGDILMNFLQKKDEKSAIIFLNTTQNISTDKLNDCFLFANKRDYRCIMVSLLKHKNFDPSLHNNYILRMAIEEGNEDLVMLLLNDDRVDPKVGIRPAKIYERHNILKLLLDK